MSLEIKPGMVFGRITILSFAKGHSIRVRHRWNCRCSCGNVLEKAVQDLTRPKVPSCGCYAREQKLGKPVSTTHGMAHHPLYKLWTSMKQRCQNPGIPQYKNYGARGISVCDEWKDFAKFVSDMGDRPDGYQLDRIDGNKGYSKENCRWADRVTQNRNTSRNVLYTIGEESLCLAAWCDRYGVDYGIASSRISRSKMPILEALTLPYSKGKSFDQYRTQGADSV